MVEGLFQTRNQIPLPVVMAKNENILVMFSLATGHKSQFHSYGIREARWTISTGALLQFLWQEVTRSVATLLGWDDSPLQVTPNNCQNVLTNWPVPFTLLEGERHWEGNVHVSCLRTWQSGPSLGSIVDLLIGSPTDVKPLSHQLPTPTQPPLPITVSQHWQKRHWKQRTLVVKP